MFSVYVIQHDSTKEIYIGFTSNLRRRLIEHQSRGNTSTKRKVGKWHLIYAEAYRAEADARLRERRLKSHGSGKQGLIKRIKASLLDT